MGSCDINVIVNVICHFFCNITFNVKVVQNMEIVLVIGLYVR